MPKKARQSKSAQKKAHRPLYAALATEPKGLEDL
jgi:hypothetical protein